MKKLICLFVLLLLYITSYGIEYKDINIPSAVVIDNTTHRILYDKNCHEKRSIASLTKVLTSILLVEACNLDEVVTVPNDATWIGGSEVGLKKNDNITVYNLLVGMLLPSGNDCAYTTAIHVGGNIENFAKMMNDKAMEIGCLNSSFANPHGLDNESHYSTAYDMALITSYALKNKTIADIVSSKSLNIKFGNTSKNINNTNRLLSGYPYTNGVKTGYTALAERCLITSAIKDDFNIITVVLGASTTDIRFNTAKKLMEDTYNIYKVTDISNIFKFNINLDVKKSKIKIVKNISRNFICP
ncbi:MAG: D-alanyl-D-alanine carboxypeptidase family protein, partial [Clostridia bacterium]